MSPYEKSLIKRFSDIKSDGARIFFVINIIKTVTDRINHRKHSGEYFPETAWSLKQNIVSGYEAKLSTFDNFLDNFRKWRK